MARLRLRDQSQETNTCKTKLIQNFWQQFLTGHAVDRNTVDSNLVIVKKSDVVVHIYLVLNCTFKYTKLKKSVKCGIIPQDPSASPWLDSLSELSPGLLSSRGGMKMCSCGRLGVDCGEGQVGPWRSSRGGSKFCTTGGSSAGVLSTSVSVWHPVLRSGGITVVSGDFLRVRESCWNNFLNVLLIYCFFLVLVR